MLYYIRFTNAVHNEQGNSMLVFALLLVLVLVVVAIVANIALSVLEIESVQDGINWLIENGGTN